jgi:hypothetical protein
MPAEGPKREGHEGICLQMSEIMCQEEIRVDGCSCLTFVFLEHGPKKTSLIRLEQDISVQSGVL